MWWGPVQRILKWAREASAAGRGLQAAGPPAPCTGTHDQHICALAAGDNFADIKSLTEKPAYVCVNCGRVAANAGNLCNPLALDSISIGVPPL